MSVTSYPSASVAISGPENRQSRENPDYEKRKNMPKTENTQNYSIKEGYQKAWVASQVALCLMLLARLPCISIIPRFCDCQTPYGTTSSILSGMVCLFAWISPPKYGFNRCVLTLNVPFSGCIISLLHVEKLGS